jgi:hypothetical protein
MRDARAEDDTRVPADCSPRAVLDFYRDPAPARRLRAFNAAAGLPKPPAQQLQRALNHAALARDRARLLAGHDEKSPVARRLNACAGAGGTAWLSCCPTSEYTTIKDRDYRAAVRLRLGVTPVEVPVDNCPVCPRHPSFAAAPSHLVSCTYSMHCNGASTIGHSLVGNAMVHYLTAAGMICRPEVRFLRGDRKTRPDYLVADAHGGLLLTDHTIINPLAASRAAKPVPSVLEDVAGVKREKYTDDANWRQEPGRHVHPSGVLRLRPSTPRRTHAPPAPISPRIRRPRQPLHRRQESIHQPAALRRLLCHPEAQRSHRPHGPAEDLRCYASSARPDRHSLALSSRSAVVRCFLYPWGSE